MNNKILILCAGGTISMQESASGLVPNPNFASLLQEDLQKQNIADCVVLAHDYQIDSSSARPQDWLNLAQKIKDLSSEFSKIIVLHGTDTLAYSSAALAQLLSALPIQIILTASQIPYFQEKSDAQNNLAGAIAFIRQDWRGVAVFFHDKLLNANAIKKIATDNFAAFITPNAPVYGFYRGGSAFLEQKIEVLPQHNFITGVKYKNIAAQVAYLYLSPGMPSSVYEALLENNSLKSLIILSYGAGNFPSDENFQSALKKAQQRGLRIINCSQCLFGAVKQDTYAVGAGHLGIISGKNRTPESLFVEEQLKFMFEAL